MSARSPRSRAGPLAALSTGLVVLAAFGTSCGSGATASPSGSPHSSVAESTDPSGALRYRQTALSSRPGTVAVRFTNDSPVPHNMTFRAAGGGPVLGATPTFSGGTRTLTLHLKPGVYTFYCSVPGHRAAGMQGTLTVR